MIKTFNKDFIDNVKIHLFTFPVRIYLEDTDSGGIVYHANYLKYAERARTIMFSQLGFNHAQLMSSNKIMFVVKFCSINYCFPARLGDNLMVETFITNITGATVILNQRIVKGTTLLVDIVVKLACINLHDHKPLRIPTAVRELLCQHLQTH